MADDPTAYLAGIKDRAKVAADFPLAEFAGLINHDTKTVGGWIAASALDVPALVAAVEAVLKAADDFDFEASRQERGAGLSAASGGMIIPAGQRGRADTHRDCARTLREAITAALAGTGKEGSEDG